MLKGYMLVKVSSDMPFEMRTEWKVALVLYSGDCDENGLITIGCVRQLDFTLPSRPYTAVELFAKDYLDLEDGEHSLIAVFMSDDTVCVYNVERQITVEYVARFKK